MSLNEFWGVSFATFLALLPLINPIGSIAIFTSLTEDFEPGLRRSQALKTTLYVFLILTVFTLAGQLVLDLFGISVGALQVAGAIVIVHTGFGMIVPRPKLREDEDRAVHQKTDISFVPMALPFIAGPGTIAVVVARATPYNNDPMALGAIILSILGATIVTGVCLLFGTSLMRFIGPAGLGAITRVLGFLILAIGVQIAVVGVNALLRGAGLVGA